MNTKALGSIIVGRAQVDPRLPSHVRGVHEGNWPTNPKERNLTNGSGAQRPTAPTRSTGINAKDRLPIDPDMPRLPPA